MAHTPAYERFFNRVKQGFENWHEGEGYDLDALAEISRAERKDIFAFLTDREITWREVEALAKIDLPAAAIAVREASQHHLNIDTRVAAAKVLHEQGRLPEIDAFIATQLRNLSVIRNGLARTLLLAQEHPTETVKQALLWASYNSTECAPHCAGLLCYLTGAAKDTYDKSLRPLFQKLDLHNSYFDRKAAFDELCKLVKMELDTSQG